MVFILARAQMCVCVRAAATCHPRSLPSPHLSCGARKSESRTGSPWVTPAPGSLPGLAPSQLKEPLPGTSSGDRDVIFRFLNGNQQLWSLPSLENQNATSASQGCCFLYGTWPSPLQGVLGRIQTLTLL